MASTPTASATVSIDSLRAPQGCVAYLVVDDETRTALAVDPRLDQVDSLVETAGARGARIAYVMDTHTHADHLSGARPLARRTGAVLLAHAASKLRAPARRVRGGDTVKLGATTVTVIDAPGHTPDSVALHVGGHLFTGDALFAGGAGRTDFMGGSASDLFDTLRTFATLPDMTVVHPGHDYVGRPTTTIADEKAHNPLLLETDRAAFAARMAGTAEPPPDMAAVLRHNLAEADGATVAPRELEGLRGGEPSPLVLDVRTPLEFESERIEGSVNVPLDQLDARIDELPEGRDVVVVCRTGVRATIAADVLGRAGRGARVLEGGVQAWRRAGLPLREGRKRLPVDRQVQLIAGSMVLTGVVLGTLASPWFLAVSAFFGAGLAFAGATGTCGLALVLMRMPWNRPLAAVDASGGAVCAAGGGAASVCAATTSTCAAPTEPAGKA